MTRSRRTFVSAGLLLMFMLAAAPTTSAVAASNANLYYVALGDSLSTGVQPDPNGLNRDQTTQGYADQLYATLVLSMPQLKLQKLGCSGETTATMIAGGICPYNGSQLAEAVSFLSAKRGSVVLVTIDLGANDIESCGSLTGFDQACVASGFASVAANLPYILSTLRAAAGPGVPIVAMNYYNPFVAAWLLGQAGQDLAHASSSVVDSFNMLLGSIYSGFGVPVADVATTFHADDFTIFPPVDIPLTVVLVCPWPFMCAPPPVGPNIHPTVVGYSMISNAFLAVLPPF